ncbi:type IV pilin [Halobiforma nitratireducens]|uniref:Flagellin domain-containing protein n=1 Tax=Halobiforma nitratireducens JCM 10879 TaxID=1227454 RepID=M0M118_9EURY|nr:type IV pilin N-terminal domain-containing protein [Halobiforma nitratireducens]EMA39492.1 flagellin domain-containing protein [Halobiforma nitratireducens JCM 10879]
MSFSSGPDQSENSRDRSLRSDDLGVSPIVGVVLLLAITVVLAGAVHVFAFGIVDSSMPLETQPKAAFTFDSADCKGDGIEIGHVAGDSIPADELYVTVDNRDLSGSWAAPKGYSTSNVADGSVSAGDVATVCADDLDGETVRVRWQSDSGDRSAILAEWAG